jgi:hypothetical protein
VRLILDSPKISGVVVLDVRRLMQRIRDEVSGGRVKRITQGLGRVANHFRLLGRVRLVVELLRGVVARQRYGVAVGIVHLDPVRDIPLVVARTRNIRIEQAGIPPSQKVLEGLDDIDKIAVAVIKLATLRKWQLDEPGAHSAHAFQGACIIDCRAIHARNPGAGRYGPDDFVPYVNRMKLAHVGNNVDRSVTRVAGRHIR